MASTAQKRQWWADYRCNRARMVGVEFPGWSTPLLVADEAAPAWELFADLMQTHGYFFRESAGGTYNCRKIAGSDSWSLHAYGIALDLNPSKNPYGTEQYDFPRPFINDVLATGLFRWGIQFDDPMHWEIDVPPDQIGELVMPISDADVDRIADRTALKTANLKITRGSTKVSWIQETADIKSLLLADAGDVSDADLDAAVDRLIDVLPSKTIAALKAKL